MTTEGSTAETHIDRHTHRQTDKQRDIHIQVSESRAGGPAVGLYHTDMITAQ